MAELPGPSRKPPLPKPPGRHHHNHHHQPRPLPAVHKPRHHRITIPPDTKKPSTTTSIPRLLLTLLLYTLLLLLLLLIFLVVTGAVLYAWLLPRAPDLRVTSLSANNAILSSSADVGLEVRNPNDAIRFRYDHIRVLVKEDPDGVVLVHGAAPAFVQGANSTTSVRVSARVSDAAVSTGAGQALVRRFEEGRMGVGVSVEFTVDAFIGEWHTGGLPVRALCDNVDMAVMAASGVKPKCSIYLHDWIRLW